jgi:hypothetical protein
VTPAEAALLFGAGAAAGAVNAVAGGGTLLTFPALLVCGVSPLRANATSTVALVAGLAGSFYGYRRQLADARPWLPRLAPVSLLGGLLGAVLLLHLGESVFERAVPFLVLFATLLFMTNDSLRPALSRFAASRTTPAPWSAVAFQFAVALYGGYFGAGIGILMLATFSLLHDGDIHQHNGLKTILGGLVNLVAAGWFAVSGLVIWPAAAAVAAGALAGHAFASHYSQQLPERTVRRLITAIGLGLALLLFARQGRGG